MRASVKELKQELRERIWRLMEERGIAVFPLPCRGRIPNFKGSDAAAERLRKLPIWKKAKVVFANPDAAQKKVRELALKDGKAVVMASPRLRSGFVVLQPSEVKGAESYAATIKGAFKLGRTVEVPPKPDIIVTGCVAVDRRTFYRLGKGGGYGDREIELIRKLYGDVPVVTTVHDVQLVEGVPFEDGDYPVDVVVTPTKVLYRRKLQ